MARGRVELTVDDIIATLKNSNLPSVIVEGRDDLIVYRRIEEEFSQHFVSVLPAGGQDKIIELFLRREEYIAGKRVAFIADRDRWVFEPLPNRLLDELLIFTDGYSVENDVARDGNFEILMSVVERASFNVELSTVLKWFSLAMSNFLHGRPEPLSTHPNQLFADPLLDAECSKMLAMDEHARMLYGDLVADPLKLLRGKTLFALLLRQLSYRGRIVGHQPLSLMDMVGAKPGHHIMSIFDGVKSALKL